MRCPEDQALKTLQSALRMQGFALVQDHGVLKVVPEADAKLQGVPTYVGNAPVARGDQVVTQVFVLKNESANNLLPVLRPLISPNNTVAAYPANNTIVVTDYADNVRRIAQIIAGVDTAAGQAVAVVPLKNANAIDIATQLTKMLDPGAIGSTDATLKVIDHRRPAHQFADDPRVERRPPRRREGTRAAARRADHDAGQHARRAAAQRGRDETREDLARHARQRRRRWRRLVGRLERSEFVQPGRRWRLVGQQFDGHVRYAAVALGRAQQQLDVLADERRRLGLERRLRFRRPARRRQRDEGDDNQGGGMIQADAATNSLIITAPEPVYRNLRAVIDQLDARRAQVYIEALIVELNSNTNANLGIQWQVANSSIYAGTNLVDRHEQQHRRT